jgi:transposase
MELTNNQWNLIKDLLPALKWKQGKAGRPPQDNRNILNGILWILRTGAPWKDLPDRYPPYQTCHRRFQFWVKTGTFKNILTILAKDLQKRGKIDITEAFIDGSFAGAKKGGSELVRQNAEKAARSWQLQTSLVFLSQSTLEVLLHTK